MRVSARTHTEYIHPSARSAAEETRSGTLSRREFFARATSLGVGVAAAYAMIGLPAPKARAATPQQGGTLRIQSEVRPLKDPRTYDWPQMSNYTRGWLEYLVEYNRDGTIRPMLLEDWSVSDDATEYVLNLRRGVKWTNGDDFIAEHLGLGGGTPDLSDWEEVLHVIRNPEGRATVGFNPTTGKWVSTWIDSMSPYFFHFEGESPDGGKTLAFRGKGPHPETGELVDYRSQESATPDGRVFEMFLGTPDGEVQILRYTYSRK